MFSWLQRKVRDSILAGVNEAIAELAGANPATAPELPEPIRLLLPAPPEDDRPAPAVARKSKAS